MVVPAQEFEVFEVGGAAVGPVPDVVCLAEARRSGAAGGLAVVVAGDECFPEFVGDVADGAADVDDGAGSVGDDPADLAVAGNAIERGP